MIEGKKMDQQEANEYLASLLKDKTKTFPGLEGMALNKFKELNMEMANLNNSYQQAKADEERIRSNLNMMASELKKLEGAVSSYAQLLVEAEISREIPIKKVQTPIEKFPTRPSSIKKEEEK